MLFCFDMVSGLRWTTMHEKCPKPVVCILEFDIIVNIMCLEYCTFVVVLLRCVQEFSCAVHGMEACFGWVIVCADVVLCLHFINFHMTCEACSFCTLLLYKGLEMPACKSGLLWCMGAILADDNDSNPCWIFSHWPLTTAAPSNDRNISSSWLPKGQLVSWV